MFKFNLFYLLAVPARYKSSKVQLGDEFCPAGSHLLYVSNG